MPRVDYKAEYKAAKVQISELQNQVTVLKDRMIELRKAKNQTVLKTAIINRNIFEPQFGTNSNGEQPTSPTITTTAVIPSIIPTTKLPVKDTGVNTDTPPPPPKPLVEPTEQVVKRTQRKRVKEGWSQCKVYTASMMTQANFVQTCHCEGIANSAPPTPAPSTPAPAAPVGRTVTPVTHTGQTEVRTISRMKTNEYISADSHTAELAAVQAAYKTERNRIQATHGKEISSLKETIVQLNAALKTALEENSSKQAHAGAGGVFHLYAEEKRRMEDQVRHINTENAKLRSKVKKLVQELQDREDLMDEEIERIKEHTTATWDEQYRSWMSKTESKMSFLRQSNDNMQSFLIKNARHLPFGATNELLLFNEYGEKVTVFQ